MADLTAPEQAMFAKYQGRTDLVADEEFWLDVLVRYGEGGGTNIPLPIEYNPLTVRRLLDDLDCPPGGCTMCCSYPRTTVKEADDKRIRDNVENPVPLNIDAEGVPWLDTSEGCPYLKDGACSIYDHRPDVCYLFPIMGGRTMVLDGGEVKQMVVRIRCMPSLQAVRHIIEEAMEGENKVLLPDLTVLTREEE